MEQKIWFILSEGQVTGPYNDTEVEERLSSAKDPQIWGRGHSEWMTSAHWKQNLKSTAKTESQKPKAETYWKVRIEGKEQKPLKYTDLISYLKTITDFSAVDICPDTDIGVWKEIYAYSQIAADLGITRRSHPRVPIVGKLICERSKGEITCRVISISEGGLGINDGQDLKIGERFKATLTSPNLFVTITSSCEVVYIGADGYAGLKFVGLPIEFKSSIIEYVNKFANA
ncbi:MAG: PilZ domain-containing protein [Pseudobdellovibrionaceae bacterium]